MSPIKGILTKFLQICAIDINMSMALNKLKKTVKVWLFILHRTTDMRKIKIENREIKSVRFSIFAHNFFSTKDSELC